MTRESYLTDDELEQERQKLKDALREILDLDSMMYATKSADDLLSAALQIAKAALDGN